MSDKKNRLIPWDAFQEFIDERGDCADCIEFLKDKEHKCEPVCPHWQSLEVPDKYVPIDWNSREHDEMDVYVMVERGVEDDNK